MTQQMFQQIIATYLPGFEWLVIFIVAHVILSTIAHIQNKDFKISEWPKFLETWLLFMIGVALINGTVVVATGLASAGLLLPVVSTLQAMIYAMYFGYYLDNIFKHLNMMGLPVDPGLIQFIKSMITKVSGYQFAPPQTTETTPQATTVTTTTESTDSHPNEGGQ